jgi:hypothetical protein
MKQESPFTGEALKARVSIFLKSDKAERHNQIKCQQLYSHFFPQARRGNKHI